MLRFLRQNSSFLASFAELSELVLSYRVQQSIFQFSESGQSQYANAQRGMHTVNV